MMNIRSVFLITILMTIITLNVIYCDPNYCCNCLRDVADYWYMICAQYQIGKDLSGLSAVCMVGMDMESGISDTV